MKKNSLTNILIIGAVAFVVEIVLGFLFIGSFMSTNDKNYSEHVISDLGAEIRGSAKDISDDLFDTKRFLELSVSTAGGDEDILVSAEFLGAISEKTSAYKGLYLDENNIAYDSNGDTYDLSGADYSGAVREKSIIYTDDNHIDGKASFIIVGNPGEGALGRVLALVGPEVFDENVSDDEGFDYSFYAILDSDKKVVCSAGRTANLLLLEGNLWSNLQSYSLTDADWNEFSQGFGTDKQPIIEVKQYKVQRYITYAKIEGTDWVLLAGYDKSMVEKQLEAYLKPAKIMRIEMVFCLIALAVTYAIVVILLQGRSSHTSRELTGKAETDLLTGVNNKLSTEAKIQEYIRNNPGGQGVLVLIDVDNFKKINDTMGHAFGDEVLRNLGMRLKSLYRATDIIGRIGGDEFIVFLKDIHDMGVIERETRKLETFFRDFEVGEYTKYSVGASLGATVYPIDGQDFETLYKNADTALYYVKQHGKNRLCFYKEEEKFGGSGSEETENP